MTKRIRPTDTTLPRIRDTSESLSRLAPVQIQEALDAESADETLSAALAPLSLRNVREELLKRLQSSGGRPALSGTTRRAKIPLSDEEWAKLEEFAAAIATPGFAPSAGQVASVLLSLSLDSIASRLGSQPAASSLAREFQTLARKVPLQ